MLLLLDAAHTTRVARFGSVGLSSKKVPIGCWKLSRRSHLVSKTLCLCKKNAGQRGRHPPPFQPGQGASELGHFVLTGGTGARRLSVQSLVPQQHVAASDSRQRHSQSGFLRVGWITGVWALDSLRERALELSTVLSRREWKRRRDSRERERDASR